MKAYLLGMVDRLRTDGKPASLSKSNITNSKQTAVSDSHKSFKRQKIGMPNANFVVSKCDRS